MPDSLSTPETPTAQPRGAEDTAADVRAPERHVVKLLAALEGQPTRPQIIAVLDALGELSWERYALVRLEAAHRLRLRSVVLDECWIERRRTVWTVADLQRLGVEPSEGSEQ